MEEELHGPIRLRSVDTKAPFDWCIQILYDQTVTTPVFLEYNLLIANACVKDFSSTVKHSPWPSDLSSLLDGALFGLNFHVCAGTCQHP